MSCILDGKLQKRSFKVFKVKQPPRCMMYVCRMSHYKLFMTILNNSGDYLENNKQNTIIFNIHKLLLVVVERLRLALKFLKGWFFISINNEFQILIPWNCIDLTTRCRKFWKIEIIFCFRSSLSAMNRGKSITEWREAKGECLFGVLVHNFCKFKFIQIGDFKNIPSWRYIGVI